jgi:Uma2 family endonuclease
MMGVTSTNNQTIDYPESDGKPMGETDWHIDWTLRLRDMLKYRYRDQRVYVGSDLLLYYHEGVPRDFVVPDGFVVLDCDPQRRRVFKTWEEKRVPNVVFEFTSASTRRSDEFFKPRTYAEIGVAEYFIFDPHAEYLTPALQGFRLTEESNYARIEADTSGRLDCRELGLTLELDGSELVIRDATSGQILPTQADAALQREQTARCEADELAVKNAILELEMQRLRDELERRS